tara:strand:+ start:855 stop:995 length:141 start_codon:yes stop_codon:yes gene_type:complete
MSALFSFVRYATPIKQIFVIIIAIKSSVSIDLLTVPKIKELILNCD